MARYRFEMNVMNEEHTFYTTQLNPAMATTKMALEAASIVRDLNGIMPAGTWTAEIIRTDTNLPLGDATRSKLMVTVDPKGKATTIDITAPAYRIGHKLQFRTEQLRAIGFILLTREGMRGLTKQMDAEVTTLAFADEETAIQAAKILAAYDIEALDTQMKKRK